MSTTAIELPLFPLNVVLFPGMVLPLHIFELRYRQMIADCLHEEKPFGIVLLKPESEHLQEIPYVTGTIATIRDLEELEDGGYNLLAVGTTRFRIVTQHREKPYLSGWVEPFEDTDTSAPILQAPVVQARELFISYLELLLEDADVQDISANLPESPEALSYCIASVLDVQDGQKQRYLEMTSTQQRLDEMISVLRREVPFMRQILAHDVPYDRAMLN